MRILIYWFVLMAATLLSFMFSGMEAGSLMLNRMRIRQMARKGSTSARLLREFMEQPERFLWTILVGNTIANFVAIGIVVNHLHHRLEGRPVLFWAAFLGCVFLLYAFCDLLPKLLFRTFPNRLCLLAAKPFQAVSLVLKPLIAMVSWLSHGLARWTGGKTSSGAVFGNRDEMKLMMQESAHALSSEERAMINRVLDLQNIPLRRVMVPLEKAVTVPENDTMAEVARLCQERNLNRVPVWHEEEGRRRIAGIVSLRLALYRPDFQPDHQAGQYLKPALYLDEDTTLENALARLQRSGERLAIVLGRDRREIGLVSLQDILRTIFGEVNL